MTIAGTEEEVLDAAMPHMINRHGYQDSPELRDQIRSTLKEEKQPSMAHPE